MRAKMPKLGLGLGLLAALVACLIVPAAASAAGSCPLPATTGTGMNSVIDVQGDIAANRTGGYLQIPFTVPAGQKAVQVRYSYDQADNSCSGPETLDMGVYQPKANPSSPVFEQTDRRGWSGSAVKNLAIAENGFSDEAVYNGGNGTNQRKNFVDGKTTRAYKPGPIQAGQWAVELGVAYIDPADTDGIHFHVQVLTSSDPVWGNAPYAPSGPPDDSLDGPNAWYLGDLHVHGEQEPGNATMKQTFEAAFGLGGAGLDFITLVDHNNNIAHNDMKTQADEANGLVIPGVEVTTYRGHWNNQGSDYFADFRGGPIYSESSPDNQIDDSELVKVSDGVKPKDEMAAAQAGGGWTQINHPAYFRDTPASCRGCAWSYSDEDTDFSKVDAIEISNSIGALQASLPFTTDGIAYYEHALDSGAHIAAVGSSDAHKAATDPISPVGQGATEVYSNGGLRDVAIVDGIKRGNTYVLPFGSTGPRLSFEAQNDAGDRDIIGGSISGHTIKLTANVDRTAAAARTGTWEVTLLQDGVPIDTAPITGNTISQDWDVTESGRYGIEVTRTQGTEFIEAYTTPIWVTVDPSNKVTVGKPKANKKKGTATLSVKVPGAGSLKLSGKSIATDSAKPKKASTVKLLVKATGKLKKSLAKKGKATANVTVAFTPTGGETAKKKVTVKLIRKK